jgi:type IV pilus assembly protein PilX
MNSSTIRMRRERGAILVTSLLLLLILTVLGVAMMKMTNMQERMAGNTRDLNLALQGAEAALRDGERELDDMVDYATPTNGAGCVVCEPDVLPVNLDDPTVFDWEANAHEFGVDGTQEFAGLPQGNLDEDPRFTIEETARRPESADVTEESMRVFYTVTSRSTGSTGQANTVLQSTYVKRVN